MSLTSTSHRRDYALTVSEGIQSNASFVSDEPWESYSKAQLPKALPYPVGGTSSNDSLTPAIAARSRP